MPYQVNREKIELERRARGWSQEALGKHAGLSKMGIWKIENGVVKNPEAGSMKKIADAFGFKVLDLYVVNGQAKEKPVTKKSTRALVGRKARVKPAR